MNELKTLRDLLRVNEVREADAVEVENLRREAAKRAESYLNKARAGNLGTHELEYNRGRYDEIVDFCNIREGECLQPETCFGIPLEKLHKLIQKIKEVHPEWME